MLTMLKNFIVFQIQFYHQYKYKICVYVYTSNIELKIENVTLTKNVSK